MKLLFWFSIFLTFYAYVLYPGWLFLRARLYPRPIDRKPVYPKISIVLAVRNEGKHLAAKLSNLQRLDYPRELLDIFVVSDASTDQTNDILKNPDDSRVHAILLPEHAGKAEALNRAIEAATGEIVVFMDARQRIANDGLRTLAEALADPSVGCVSGALQLGDGEDHSPKGVGSYWKMEKGIRSWESTAGSVVGATGALYAVRRNLIPHLPPGLILDDVFIPMEVVRRGVRVIFEPRALAWDSLPSNPQQEFRRKVRTLFGNYQLLRFAPWLLTSANPLRFEFFSHKLCRLAVPFALLGMILSSFFLSGYLYRLPLAAAVGVVAFGFLALLRRPLGIVSRLTDLALAFVLLNTAAIVAFFYFAVGKKRVWVS
ncbi:MAG TPA: glycosyltransferase family 2 protein [Candidatus Acidoferrum sp.]|jgi:cellulose synthase/poly-beta-1,6-N-acetylglucosamine synthase-like glycosyltransferase